MWRHFSKPSEHHLGVSALIPGWKLVHIRPDLLCSVLILQYLLNTVCLKRYNILWLWHRMPGCSLETVIHFRSAFNSPASNFIFSKTRPVFNAKLQLLWSHAQVVTTAGGVNAPGWSVTSNKDMFTMWKTWWKNELSGGLSSRQLCFFSFLAFSSTCHRILNFDKILVQKWYAVPLSTAQNRIIITFFFVN